MSRKKLLQEIGHFQKTREEEIVVQCVCGFYIYLFLFDILRES